MISRDRFNEILSNFKNIKSILVVGDVGVDKYTYGEVRRISPEAPVPVLEVRKEWMKLGLAANVSDNLKSLGVESTLCGVIGDDNNANKFEDLLDECELKTWGIVRDASRMTTFKERIVTEIQQVCRVDYETSEAISNDTYARLKDRFENFKHEHSSIIIEDYGKGLLRENVLNFLIEEGKNLGKLVAVDPSRSTPPLWYKGATLLKPNKVECEMMVKSLGYNQAMPVEKMAEILVDKLALSKIIVTLGAEGMAIWDSSLANPIKRIPTVAKEVFDVSGAGDTAISAITASLTAGATLEEAAWIGNCASGVVVAKKGTALVTITELQDHFEHLVELGL
jgi:D-glycero-beta-D-manno-heptose-7-phosphate kinase